MSPAYAVVRIGRTPFLCSWRKSDMPKVTLLLPGSESGLGPGPASPSTTWTLEGLQDVGTEV